MTGGPERRGISFSDNKVLYFAVDEPAMLALEFGPLMRFVNMTQPSAVTHHQSIGKGDWKSFLTSAANGPNAKPNVVVRTCVLSYKFGTVVAIVVDVLDYLDERDSEVMLGTFPRDGFVNVTGTGSSDQLIPEFL